MRIRLISVPQSPSPNTNFPSPFPVKRIPLLSLAILLICYIGFGWYLSGLTPPSSARLLAICNQMLGVPPATVQSAPHGMEKDPGKPQSRSQDQKPPEHQAKESGAATPEPTNTNSQKPPESQPQESGAATPESARVETANPTAPNSLEAESGKQRQTDQTTEVTTEGTQANSKNLCHMLFRHNLPIALLAIGWIFISSIAFISPLTTFSRFINRWFKSDTVAIMTIFMIAGMAAVILYWLHVFLQILTILAAESLARIDIQTARLSGVQAYWILTMVSLIGLVIGWLGNGVL